MHRQVVGRMGGDIRFLLMSESGLVLVVEDDTADVQRSARLALASHVERIDLLSAVEMLDETLAASPYDVVLLDMNFVAGERSGAARPGQCLPGFRRSIRSRGRVDDGVRRRDARGGGA